MAFLSGEDRAGKPLSLIGRSAPEGGGAGSSPVAARTKVHDNANESEKRMVTEVEVDPFASPTQKAQDPTSAGGGFVPLAGIATGRLVLILPVSLERKVLSEFKDKNGNDQYGPKMTADIAVLSGETDFFWQDGKGEDHDFEVEEIPHVFEGVFINSAPLVDRTEDARRTDTAATMSLGRLIKPKAYDLKAPNEKDLTIARKFLASATGKKFAAHAQAMHEKRVADAAGDGGGGEESKAKNPFG